MVPIRPRGWQFLEWHFEPPLERIMARPMKSCNSRMLRGQCDAVCASTVRVGIALMDEPCEWPATCFRLKVARLCGSSWSCGKVREGSPPRRRRG